MEQNPTQDALNARLSPQATNIYTPSEGIFRAVGDFGTTLYRNTGSGLTTLNLIGDNNGIWKDTADRTSFGNAQGQATEALNRLKNQYGIDYNSLNQVNMGDYFSQNRNLGRDTVDGWQPIYNQGSLNDFVSQRAATLNQSTINSTPNTLATPLQQPTSQPLATGGTNPFSSTTSSSSFPTSSLQPGATGDEVKKLQDYLVSQGLMTQADLSGGYGTYGPKTTAAVQALQSKLGVDNSSGPGYFGPKTLAALQGTQNQIPTGSTPFGTISPGSVSLSTNSNGVFSSDVLGSGLTTQDVLNKTQSYNDVINGFLKQQADAQAKLNDTKAYQLQGMASIRNSDSVEPLQGQDLAEFEKQMAFRTVPAEIALQNAQVGLQLFKQSPEYLAQQQSLSTAQNLIQAYPDLGVTYDPKLSPEQNLQNIQRAVSNSPKFQAQNSQVITNPITGAIQVISKLPSGAYNVNTISGGSGGTPGVSPVNSNVTYTPGASITKLPPGIKSIGNISMDSEAMQLFNGTLAPNQITATGIQATAIKAKANEISLALTGKPYDASAAQTAYDFRNSQAYQSYVGNAPTAIRNLQGMVDDVQVLGITGNLGALNWAKINGIASGMWYGSTQQQINAAKDLLSKYSQSADDIGLLLGTGSGSDAKLAIGKAIFQPNGSLSSTQQLADNVTKTILEKLGDRYKQAGVTDPTAYLSNDMASIWSNFQGSDKAAQTQSTDANWLSSYNYDQDITLARQAIANGADKSAVRARLLTKYAEVNL